jgi:hypothetical protein
MVSPKPHVGDGSIPYQEEGVVRYRKDDAGVVRYDPAPSEGWWPPETPETEAEIARLVERDVTRRQDLMDQVRRGARTVQGTIRSQYPDEALDQLDQPIRLLLQDAYTLADLVEVLADVIAPEESS